MLQIVLCVTDQLTKPTTTAAIMDSTIHPLPVPRLLRATITQSMQPVRRGSEEPALCATLQRIFTLTVMESAAP